MRPIHALLLLALILLILGFLALGGSYGAF